MTDRRAPEARYYDLNPQAPYDVPFCAAEFEESILRHGFSVIQRWGGYAGEPYGTGPELVIQFAVA